jgi:hypothetical protein
MDIFVPSREGHVAWCPDHGNETSGFKNLQGNSWLADELFSCLRTLLCAVS